MVIIFLPNGIGDTLMIVPALRRLIAVRGVDGVTVVVSNVIHRRILHAFIDPKLRTIERYDGRPLAHLRLWLRLIAVRAQLISAPMLSSEPMHAVFFASLLTQVQVPASFMKVPWKRLRTTQLSLAQFDGHQVNFFVQFLAQFEPRIDCSRVSPQELAPVGHQRPADVATDDRATRIAVGISCGERERHKVPTPAYFARLLNALAQERAVELMLLGSPSDQPLIDAFLEDLSPGISVELVIGRPIRDLIRQLADCDLGISGTTGQGHMMAAAGLPMLVLAGVTNPNESGPYVQRAAVLRHRYACGPCYQETFSYGCRQVACMETLDIEQGVRMAAKLLDAAAYGQDWMLKSVKETPVPVSTIMTLHSRPQAEWVIPQDKH